MDFSKWAKEKITLSHFTFLGFTEYNGSFVKQGFNGEIQIHDGAYWFCQNNKRIKKIVIKKDIVDIFLEQKYPNQYAAFRK